VRICIYGKTVQCVWLGRLLFSGGAGLVLVENCTVDASIKVLCFVVTIAMV
jgi:hypothetical protein